ncbi:MAG: S8 family serine peptidase [Algoriphagus sp.]|nr:S8 family serine peptidase [Algoriphagus sp.]
MRYIVTIIFVFGLWILGFSQNSSDQKLQLESVRLQISERFEQNYSQLFLPKELVKQKALARNIPLTLKLENGELADLQYFDELENPVYYTILNTNAARTTSTDALQSGGSLGVNLTGKGMVVGIYDQTRPKPDHVEFTGRLTQVDGSTETISNHATHVSGTIMATGISVSAKGMANEATGWAFNWESDLSKMNANAFDPVTKPGGHLVSNHSYGVVLGWYRNASNAWVWAGNPNINPDKDYRFGYYSSKSKGLDDLIFSKPYYTVVWAAGNDRGDAGDGTRDPDGPEDTLGPEGVAKNTITVGAVSSITEYLGPQSVAMSSFSSWGPTDDGRIKPDVVGVGVNVFSSSIGNGGTTDAYASLSGTSMAAPNVTGSLLLLQQLFGERNNGRFMWASTVKAIMINTTKEAGLSPGPDYIYGWGLLNTKSAAEIILAENGSSDVIRENNLANGSSYEYEFVSDGVTPIRITIAWTDPSGNPAPASLNPPNLMLVNDLDIRVTDEEGKTYFPWTLNPSIGPGSAAANDSDNFRDNVEQVFIASPKAQKYKVNITHKGNLVNNSQDYSLVMKAGTVDGADETLYWIGPDNGNWNDPVNWSTSANGISANKIPGSGTRVVFEGSAGGSTTVNFPVNAEAFSVNLFGDQLVNFDLKGNQIIVNNGFRVSNQITGIKNGTLLFSSASTNELLVELGNAVFENTDITFSTGKWRIITHEKLDNLIIDDALLGIDSPELRLISLGMIGAGSLGGELETIIFEKDLILESNSLIKGDLDLTFEGTEGNFNNTTTTLFDSLTLTSGKLSLLSNGINSISISNGQAIQAIPSLTFQNLTLGSSGILNLGNSGQLTVLNLFASTATANSKAGILAGSKGKLIHDIYRKYCFENINVTNVDLVGKAIITLGGLAIITNSTGWLKQNCEEVLFANFTSTYPCLGSALTFENLSEGVISSYKWDFGGLGTSTLENPFFVFNSPGTFLIKLQISNAQGSTSFEQSVEIGPNELAKPTIVVNGTLLTSQQPGLSYQWFVNGQLVPGATDRSITASEDGKYQVAIYDATCNRISDPIVISAIPDQEVDLSRFGIFVGPIPSEEKVHINISNDYSGPVTFQLIDMAGREYLVKKITKSSQELDVEMNLPGPSGLYVLKISTNSLTLHKKVIKY